MSEKSYLPSGVFLVCDKGVLPTPLTVTSALTVDILGSNVATDLDKVPMVNIKPFGVCATTHLPCTFVPVPLGWSPVKNDVVIQGAHPLLEDSKLRCTTGGGCISVFMNLSAAMLGVAGNANAALNAAVDGAIKDVEESVKQKFDNADDYLKQLGPPLGDMAREELGKAEGVWEGASGIVTGLWELTKMGRDLELKVANTVVHAIDNPAETAEAVQAGAKRGWAAAQNGDNWIKAADMASNALPGVLVAKGAVWMSDPANREKAWNVTKAAYAKANTYMADPRNRGKFKGRVAFEVAFAVLTGGMGEAANAGKAGELLNAGEKVAEAAKGAEGAMSFGKVVTGAEEAGASAAGRDAAEATGQAAKKLETVEGASKEASVCEKDPVNVATGAMLFDAVDVALPGPVPLVWERTWYSTSDRRGPLGHGWHHAYDLALLPGATGEWFMRLADGRLAAFEPLTEENGFCAFLRSEKFELRLGPDAPGQYAVYSQREQLTYLFEPAPDGSTAATSGLLLLAAVTNAAGHALRFAYCTQGHLAGITDSTGRAIGVRTDPAGRILALDLPLPDGTPGTFPAVQYAYDAAGNMTSTTDAEGHTMRFAYQGHLLTEKTFRTGARFYFEYDAQRRCTRTWGDENYFNGRFFYAEGHTVLLSEEPDARDEYYHAQGLVTRHVDPVGGISTWHYNAHGELELYRDPLDQATVYDYDARGNLMQTTRPDGTVEQVAYNAQGLPTAVTDANGSTWQRQYDEAGRLLAATDPLGAVTRYAYDEQGRLVEVVDALGHPTRLRYDAHHNLAHVVTADGHLRSRGYDALGRLTSLTDALGRVQQRRYDRLGQVVAVLEPDGTTRQLAYDAEGQVVRAHDGTQDVELAYSPAGQLVRRRQAGQQVQFAYDREGRLTQVRNEHGETYAFVLDAAGRVREEIGFDGLTRRYERDAAGRVTGVARPAGRTTAYAYDPAGRVAEVVHNGSERTGYQYRADGALLAATTDATTVQFERDALGRVLREIQDGHEVRSTYDARGQRMGLASSLGAAVTFEHDVVGYLQRTQAENWQSVAEHNGLQFQSRLSGGLQVGWHRSAAGRPTAQHITVGGTVRRRHYDWQGADQLAEIDDSLHGTTQFNYDELGNLAGARYADHTEDVRAPDALGNLFRTGARTDRRYDTGGQLRQANGTRYRYDEEGNLVKKITLDGKVWSYAWDGSGQLVTVVRPDGYAVTFTYDALGRRVSKRFRGRVTKWVWDGDKPLHEWHELEVGSGTGSIADLTTWLFEEDSFAPTAKLTEKGAYSVVCDHLGTPLAMYDGQGATTWAMALDCYGGVRQGQGKAQDCPFRYQGQYEDVETGLYYNRFRYYDPERGGYISQDPIRLLGGLHLYAYVTRPTTTVDPLGLAEFWPPSAELTEFPKNLNFGQHRIAPHFSSIGGDIPEAIRGRSLVDVAADLHNGSLSPEVFTIRYTKLPNGELVTLNNRGLAVLTMADKAPSTALYIPLEHASPGLLADLGVKHPGLPDIMQPSRSIAVTGQKSGLDRRYTISPCMKG